MPKELEDKLRYIGYAGTFTIEAFIEWLEKIPHSFSFGLNHKQTGVWETHLWTQPGGDARTVCSSQDGATYLEALGRLVLDLDEWIKESYVSDYCDYCSHKIDECVCGKGNVQRP